MNKSGKEASSSLSEDEGDKSHKEQRQHLLFIGAKRALVGGLLAGGGAIAGQYLMGRIYSGTEARQPLEAVNPSACSLGTSVVTASSTILASCLP